jgi:two-component system, OmpR family, phosphate regulon response regulator PhoB
MMEQFGQIDPCVAREAGIVSRVLVVEPNRNYMSVLARRISGAGYRVSTADSAQSALAEIHRSRPDALLAELTMKGTGGVELVQMLREDAVNRDLPLILMGGRSEAGAAVRALRTGADDVVRKPFDFEVLIARIARQIARARAVRELREVNAALDARVVTRAIELGEARDRLALSEAERHRLQNLVAAKAA